jgi:YidC/Oxa1 family membrane protein insertase
MEFDKRTLFALLLIFVIFIVWQYVWMDNAPPPPQPSAAEDSTELAENAPAEIDTQTPSSSQVADLMQDTSVTPDTIPEQVIEVTTEQFQLRLSNRGGGIVSMQLNEYTYSDSGNVFLISKDNKTATPSIESRSNEFSDAGITYTIDGED